MAAQALNGDLYRGDVFVFRSKRRDRLKLLVFDGTGTILATKWLEEGQLPTAILRSDGARRAFPRHLPSLKNSESMSAWIGVICRSSAKSN
jgi:transposase